MRALRRGEEIRPETMWTAFEHESLEWLTGQKPGTKGDGWELIEWDPETEEASDPEEVLTAPEVAAEPSEDYVTINGQTVKKSDALKMLLQ